MKEIERRYFSGESIPALDFEKSEGGLELFGDVIYFDWKRDKATQQEDMWGEVWHQKVVPHEIPLIAEQEHLLRPTDVQRSKPIV